MTSCGAVSNSQSVYLGAARRTLVAHPHNEYLSVSDQSRQPFQCFKKVRFRHKCVFVCCVKNQAHLGFKFDFFGYSCTVVNNGCLGNFEAKNGGFFIRKGFSRV